jgi:hypothetical protein
VEEVLDGDAEEDVGGGGAGEGRGRVVAALSGANAHRPPTPHRNEQAPSSRWRTLL